MSAESIGCTRPFRKPHTEHDIPRSPSNSMMIGELFVGRPALDVLNNCRARCLKAHHCSGGDTVVGSANVSSSIFAMLFVGWLVGLAMSAGMALYMRARHSRTRGAVIDPVSPAAAVGPSILHLRNVSEVSVDIMSLYVHACTPCILTHMT